MIFATGYHASGKSYFASILTDHFNTLHVETSSVVRDMWDREGNESDLQSWASNIEELYGKNYFDELIAKTIQERYQHLVDSGRDVQDVVVSGNRSLEGIFYLADYFKDHVIGYKRPNKIIAMEAGFDSLFERFKTRNRREGDANISETDFRILIESEKNRGIEDIFQYADYKVQNTGNMEEFRDWAIEFATVELALDKNMEIIDGWQIENRINKGGHNHKFLK